MERRDRFWQEVKIREAVLLERQLCICNKTSLAEQSLLRTKLRVSDASCEKCQWHQRLRTRQARKSRSAAFSTVSTVSEPLTRMQGCKERKSQTSPDLRDCTFPFTSCSKHHAPNSSNVRNGPAMQLSSIQTPPLK